MIRIAICDDEAKAITQLSDLTEKYFSHKKLMYTLSCFNNGEDFLKSDISSYDIIFLDIKINQVNGLDIAETINKKSKRAVIMLVSQFHEYMAQGYRVRAFRYILKPDLETVFFEDMDSALNELNIKNDIFEYKIYGEPIEIPYDDIIYFESEYPKVYIHTVKPITYNSFTGNIDEIDNRFVIPDFIRIGKRRLVNAKHITKITGMRAYLDNEENLAISRDYYDRAKKAFLKIKRGEIWNT